MCHTVYNTWHHHSLLLVLDMQGCSTGKKGVVYDFFFQYGPSVQVTNSDYWINFDSGFDSSITGHSSMYYTVLCRTCASMYITYGLCKLHSIEACQKATCLRFSCVGLVHACDLCSSRIETRLLWRECCLTMHCSHTHCCALPMCCINMCNILCSASCDFNKSRHVVQIQLSLPNISP